MNCSFLSRSFLGLVCMLSAVPASALAGTIDVRLQSITPTTANVRLTVSQYGWCVNPCLEETLTVTVTPCPPGKPCTNGEYVYTVTGAWVPKQLDIDLEPGVTYTFGGEYSESGANSNNYECNCSYSQGLQQVQFHVPDGPGWEIHTVSTSVDTVWVDARFWNIPSGLYPENSECRLEDTRYSIWPCPLAVFGSNPNSTCTNGTLTYRLYVRTAPVRVALRAGTTYTFAGHMQISAECPDERGWHCQVVCCNVAVAPGTTEYVPTTLAVRPSTWGYVKSMYRTP